jgi:hypothetical protein
MAVWLGACGGSFRRWRDEHGLWMLSGMFLAFSCVAFTLFVAMVIDEAVRTGPACFSVLDCSTAAILLGLQVVFLATVTCTNWSLRKKTTKNPGTPEL